MHACFHSAAKLFQEWSPCLTFLLFKTQSFLNTIKFYSINGHTIFFILSSVMPVEGDWLQIQGLLPTTAKGDPKTTLMYASVSKKTSFETFDYL